MNPMGNGPRKLLQREVSTRLAQSNRMKCSEKTRDQTKPSGKHIMYRTRQKENWESVC